MLYVIYVYGVFIYTYRFCFGSVFKFHYKGKFNSGREFLKYTANIKNLKGYDGLKVMNLTYKGSMQILTEKDLQTSESNIK